MTTEKNIRGRQLIPSPGTPGEGQGGGLLLARDRSFAPSPTLPRSTGGGRRKLSPIVSSTPSMNVVSKGLCKAIIVCFALSLCGCGYHISGSAETEPGFQWHTLYRDDVKTVAVPIFANRTYFQGVEFRLTKAIVTQLESQSPYKVVPRERADTILEGEITRVNLRTVSRDWASAVPQEQLYLIVLNFRWRDLRTGKILVERRDFEQTAPYYPTLGEDVFVGEQLNIERLALAVVQELQADWGPRPKPKPDETEP